MIRSDRARPEGHSKSAPSGHQPEADTWLDLVQAAEARALEPEWRQAVPEPGSGHDGVPMIDATSIALGESSVRGWLSRVWEIVARGGALGSSTVPAAALELHDCATLLVTGISDDVRAVDTVAARLGIERETLRTIAVVAAMPLLRACRAAWSGRLPSGWTRGHCPVCGAWPALAEARGLERERRLRCGRDGTDWAGDWLRCPYCGNSDHARLGALVPEQERDSRRVETCFACRGYLKGVATLTAATPVEVTRWDLASIELDIAALERGFDRPAPRRERRQPEVRIEPRRSWRWWRA